jgi:hypothetical protein
MLAYQSFVTDGSTFLRLHSFSYVFGRIGIMAEVRSTPKVDDPVRRFAERAIGVRHVQRTGLDKDVATVHGSLDELGFM